jgi:hypothetical protein
MVITINKFLISLKIRLLRKGTIDRERIVSFVAEWEIPQALSQHRIIMFILIEIIGKKSFTRRHNGLWFCSKISLFCDGKDF